MKVTAYTLALSLVALSLISGFAPNLAMADGPKNFLQSYTEVHNWSDAAPSEDRSTASVSKDASDDSAPAKDDSHEGVDGKFFGLRSHRY
jgi:hypothetical protein